MKRPFSKLMHFWNEDRSLSTMLLLLLLFIFVLVPGVKPGKSGGFLIEVIYSVMLLTGILSVAKHKTSVIIISVLAVAALLVNLLSDLQPTKTLLITRDVGGIFFSFFFAIVILIKTFQPGEITYYRIEGSIVVYLMLGLVFTYVFHAVYLVTGPSSFNNIKDAGLKEFSYFSFTSLTTMGYGDITPVHPFARSIANFEALIGQLYPAILIARLVSMEFESSTRKRDKM